MGKGRLERILIPGFLLFFLPFPGVAMDPSDPGPSSPLYEVLKKKPEDKIEIYGKEGDIRIEVASKSGMGAASLARKHPKWPETMVFRFYLKGLESLVISCGKNKLSASVSTQPDHAHQVHLWREGREGPPLTPDSPFMMPIQAYASDGKPVPGLPPLGGWFEISLPKAILDPSVERLDLEWIDFYR